MIPSLMAEFVATQRTRPLSLAVAVGSVILPGFLIVFLEQPHLLRLYGVLGVVILSTAMSFPILILCYALFYSPFVLIRDLQLSARGIKTSEIPDLSEEANSADTLEWPSLFPGAYVANLLLYLVAVLAYYQRIVIGHTLLLLALGLVAVWLLILAVCVLLKRRYLRESDT